MNVRRFFVCISSEFGRIEVIGAGFDSIIRLKEFESPSLIPKQCSGSTSHATVVLESQGTGWRKIGLAHFSWGPAGMIDTATIGFIFGFVHFLVMSTVARYNNFRAASDSKKFAAWDQKLLAEWHVRCRGPGIMVYWHIDKKAACIHS